MTLMDPEMLWKKKVDDFYKNERFLDVSQIVKEERIINEFKSLYIKHAFDSLGSHFKTLYLSQIEYVKNLKKQYKEKYG